MKRRLYMIAGVLGLFAVACGAAGQPLAESDSGGFPLGLQSLWKTDFSKASIAPGELIQGQTKDGIPALSDPQFVDVSAAGFLGALEPVISLVVNGDARAYPLQILIWHEIVNDVVGGRPVLVTFCPLCNTAISFDREVNGEVLEFGVSGFLRNSDLVMFDRATESWWQQITGEALVGSFTGTKLTPIPSTIISWADFREAFPDGKVLSRNTGYSRDYGNNPYIGYDDINSSPFLFNGDADGRLAPMERVVTVELGGETVAYPFSVLEPEGVIADSVGGAEVVVFFKAGTASALDGRSIADSKDIGAATVFSPIVDGALLSFTAAEGGFVDEQTGSFWNILGLAESGRLEGTQLNAIVSGNHFWFAWAAFQPETRVWSAGGLQGG